MDNVARHLFDGRDREATREREFVEMDVNTVFVNGIAFPVAVEGLLYFTGYVDQPGPRGTESVYRVRLVMPTSAWPDMRAKIDHAVKGFMRSLDG